MANRKNKGIDIFKKLDQVKDRIKTINNNVLEASDELVDASIDAGSKWQKVMNKALKEGVVLFGRQQELTIHTLEGLKGQYQIANQRVRQLLNTNTVEVAKAKKTKATAAKPAKKAAKTTRKKITVKKDDLKVIDGIGPKIESLLNEAGITTFKQLAATDRKVLEAVLENAGPRFRAHNPDGWKQEAAAAMKAAK